MSSSGDFCRMLHSSVANCLVALGCTMSWKKKLATQISVDTMKMGLSILISGMPAAFMDKSSSFSPMLPKLISDASNMARGRDMGTSVKLA